MHTRFNKSTPKKTYDGVAVCRSYFISVITNTFIDTSTYISSICEFVFFFIIWKGIFVTRFLKQYVRHHGTRYRLNKHGAMQKHAKFINISDLFFKLISYAFSTWKRLYQMPLNKSYTFIHKTLTVR